MIGCALIPRLALTSALGERREPVGRPLALAPAPGGPQVIGEVSGAAEAFGLRPGMRLAEALGRCPSLTLVAGDPVRARELAEDALRRLEAIGAAVEPARPGECFFSLDALRGLYGRPEAVLARAVRALGRRARVGGGPTRLAAFAAARRMRARRPAPIVTGRPAERIVAALGVEVLGERLGDEWERAQLTDDLRRLGIATLGDLAALPAAAIADRFGEAGLRALRLARGEDAPLRPRRPHEEQLERLALPEAVSGQQLERALAILVERLLARRDRAGRTARRLRLEARLAGGGGWSAEIVMRRASADPERLRLALGPKLAELPGPAASLALRAVELGPPAPEQGSLSRSPEDRRRALLAEAVRQTRAAAGRDAVLRVLDVEPDSRVPERRTTLTPWNG